MKNRKVIEITELPEQRKIIDLLPDFIKQFHEFPEIMQAAQIEIDDIYLAINNLFLDAYTQSATEEGIAHREKMYGIIPNPEQTLEDRRTAVIAKEIAGLPYTIRQYRAMLEAICGTGNCTAIVDNNNYKLNVSIRAVEREELSALALQKWIDDMTASVIPANMLYESILFETHRGKRAVYSGIGCSMRKYYGTEVVK